MLWAGGGGAYLFQAHLRGGLIETGGLFEREGLFNLEKTIVSYLHKELEYKAEKYKKYKKVVGHTAEDENQMVNEPSRISRHKVLQS